MAHPCIHCGGECDCNGDWDDFISCKTPLSCEGCGCEEFADDQGWNDNDEWDDDDYPWDDDDDDFEPCSDCDGHDACRDFGCAIKAGLGHMLQPPL